MAFILTKITKVITVPNPANTAAEMFSPNALVREDINEWLKRQHLTPSARITISISAPEPPMQSVIRVVDDVQRDNQHGSIFRRLNTSDAGWVGIGSTRYWTWKELSERKGGFEILWNPHDPANQERIP